MKRIYSIWILLFLIGIGIIARILYIQIAIGPELRDRAQDLLLRYDTIEPVRGSIYSFDGNLMAVSVPVFEIRMDASDEVVPNEYFLSRVDSLARGLSQLFGDRPARYYRDRLLEARRKNNRYLLIRRNVSYEELKVLRTLPIFDRGRFRGGLITIESNRRELPNQELAFRTIGWFRDGHNNNPGLESAFNHVLTGSQGKRLMQRVVEGNWRPVHDENAIEAKDGLSIVSTIDISIQDVAHSALQRQLIAHEAEFGCVVVMEVATGHIKAMVNLTKVSDSIYKERLNYAIFENYDPGSTFKLATVMALLEDGFADSTTLLETGNGITYFYGRKMEDNLKGGFGTITLNRAFELSSNVGIARKIHAAYINNPEKFINRLHAMRLNEPVGIELPGESRPLIKRPDHSTWSRYSLPWMSIGYEIQITPLQTLAFFNGVANNGRMMKPMIVSEIRQSGQTITRFEPQTLVPALASPKTIAVMQNMMRGVVEFGTARELNKAPYSIAGKTGTAQIVTRNQGYNTEDYKASFVGYFPAENPAFSCIVVIYNPRRGIIYGSAVAAPVFREIADRLYATNLNIQQQPADSVQFILPTVFASGKSRDLKKIAGLVNPTFNPTSRSAFSELAPVGNTFTMKNRNIPQDTIPNVVGMNVRDAVYLLEEQGMHVIISGHGIVVGQQPEAGLPSDTINTVNLELNIKGQWHDAQRDTL